MKIINKFNNLQTKIENKYKLYKTQKEKRYRYFLKHTDRKLPDLQTIKKWRNILFIMALMINTGGIIHMFIMWNWFFPPHPETLYRTYKEQWIGDMTFSIWGSMFMILGTFSCILDYTIHKRWKGKSALNW